MLEIDEYHLEFRRDSELIGRYYLADVEVARDIAERFILFLGEDEVEFLADDALQFAYGGVAAMQDAWLAAQKKKRRHRRAAEVAARRKDEEPRRELETVSRPLHVSDSDTLRNRRLRAGSKPPPTASPDRRAPGMKPALPAETYAEEVGGKAEGLPDPHPQSPQAVASRLCFAGRRGRVDRCSARVRGAADEPSIQAKKAASPRAPRKSAAAAGRQPRSVKNSRGSLRHDSDESTPVTSTAAAEPVATTRASGFRY